MQAIYPAACAAPAAFVLFAASDSYAFHSGGVAECEGCHTMHEAPGGSYLLAGVDQSSTCLLCHEHAGDTGPSSYHVSTAAVDIVPGTQPPKQLTPAGDFGWLRLTFSNAYTTSPGQLHGHNIVAAGNGYVADPDNTNIPAITFDATSLGCHSCHDPHGRYRRATDNPGIDGAGYSTTGGPIQKSGSYNTSTLPLAATGGTVGSYRLLAGVGYAPVSYNAGAFVAAPPSASAPSTYNRTEGGSQTQVAYGSGMSEWCGNCHGAFVNQTMGMGDVLHPAGNDANMNNQFVVGNAYGNTQPIWRNYNMYFGARGFDLWGCGVESLQGVCGYTSLVPFERHTSDFTVLRANSGFGSLGTGADANSNVMCLSCHRAHASAFDHMLRFEYGNEFMTIADAAGASIYPPASTRAGQGRSETERQKAYYDRAPTVFGPYQRVLCNKCHAKD
jgi:predicted CXXCH cytochrome family protein